MRKLISGVIFTGLLGLVMLWPAYSQTVHGVTLTWSETVPANCNCAPTGYNVLRSVTAGGENGTPINATPVAAPTTTYLDSTGTPGQTYFYEIVAVNPAGSSAPSNEVSATFLVPLAAPQSPSGLKAVAN